MEVGNQLGVILREEFKHYEEWKKKSWSQDSQDRPWVMRVYAAAS